MVGFHGNFAVEPLVVDRGIVTKPVVIERKPWWADQLQQFREIKTVTITAGFTENNLFICYLNLYCKSVQWVRKSYLKDHELTKLRKHKTLKDCYCEMRWNSAELRIMCEWVYMGVDTGVSSRHNNLQLKLLPLCTRVPTSSVLLNPSLPISTQFLGWAVATVPALSTKSYNLLTTER